MLNLNEIKELAFKAAKEQNDKLDSISNKLDKVISLLRKEEG